MNRPRLYDDYVEMGARVVWFFCLLNGCVAFILFRVHQNKDCKCGVSYNRHDDLYLSISEL